VSGRRVKNLVVNRKTRVKEMGVGIYTPKGNERAFLLRVFKKALVECYP
jgi:hypothetical protein